MRLSRVGECGSDDSGCGCAGVKQGYSRFRVAASDCVRRDFVRHEQGKEICLATIGLLPKLGGPAYERERWLVLSALRRFGDLTPLPADRYAIRALYFEALEQYHRAGDAYRQILAATHADSHEFMTTMQTYWTFLLEHGLHDDALELLLENYPRVPRRDLEELNELIRQTFKYRVTARRRKAPSRRRGP